MRAKTIKNKPKVNDIVPTATLMKRLEQKISDLQNSLDEERRKNKNLIKVSELEKQIMEMSTKFINSSISVSNSDKENQYRRRTWCGVAFNNANNAQNTNDGSNGETPTNENSNGKSKLPMKKSNFTSRLQTPKNYNSQSNGDKSMHDNSMLSSTPCQLPKVSEEAPKNKARPEHISLLRTPQVHLQNLKNKCSLTPKDTVEGRLRWVCSALNFLLGNSFRLNFIMAFNFVDKKRSKMS